ncbi:hypothetical protein PG985_014282 [Apiospora marii]|uniref:Peptidase C14 caspase domain-containing protein n=1 Tax=Apiospora marii TaxID=335849 RepID=A0ABR1R5K4_9PEZI
MEAQNRALLIGSNYDDLPGTEHDVRTMQSLLQSFGFRPANVKTLSGKEATRQQILDSWRDLILQSNSDDSVVIYYSGHGGLTKQDESNPADSRSTEQEPNYFQYLVPSDFDKTLREWKGILDSEISKLLRDTTNRTPNVTYILDCCHSSRLGRGLEEQAIAKSMTNDAYNLLKGHIERLRKRHELLEDDNWSNPNVVRIAAAADTKRAWQYKSGRNQYVGLFTEKLDSILRQSRVKSSWRNVLVGVNALIEKQFNHEQDPQKPRSGGADGRLPFSLQVDSSQATVAEIHHDHVLIHGGKLRGIAVGDQFSLTPLIPDPKSRNRNDEWSDNMPTVTEIFQVNGLEAVGKPVKKKGYGGALACRVHRAQRWPIQFPSTLAYLERLIDECSDFRRREAGEETLVEFRTSGDNGQSEIALFTPKYQIGPWKQTSKSSIDELFSSSSKLAQARDLLALETGIGEERLDAEIQINIGTIRNHNEDLRPCYSSTPNVQTAKLEFTAGDEYGIELNLQGDDKHYVSVFRVDATGTIHFVSRAWEKGIKLKRSTRRHVIRGNNIGLIRGIRLPWPLSFRGVAEVEEAFVFIITDKETSLGFLETATPENYDEVEGHAQKSLGWAQTAARMTRPHYDVVRIPYVLRAPSYMQGSDTVQSADDSDDDHDGKFLTAPCLPSPERTEEWESPSPHFQGEYTASKGLLGAVFRGLTGAKSQVQVVNEHDEDITVVVSRYCAHRKLSGMGVTVSGTAFGFSFETTTFKSPATSKILVPKKLNQAGSFAIFPLWTRMDGFGVITIFTGRGNDRKLFIENDLIRVGATVYFRGNANLDIVEPSSSTRG